MGNRLSSVTLSTGGAATSFKYDGAGNLVAKLVGNVTTYYIGGVHEVEVTNTTVTKKTTYYPAGGAMRVDVVGGSNTVYYVVKDHLGSASVTLDSSGNIAAEVRYYPFGETRVTSGTMPTDRLYTGQQQVANLGLYNYGARFYDPRLGRFISADTILPNFANPQSLNRFSYVVNNPLKYIDPTGHEACSGTTSFISQTTGDGGISWANCWAQQTVNSILTGMGIDSETADFLAKVAVRFGARLDQVLKWYEDVGPFEECIKRPTWCTLPIMNVMPITGTVTTTGSVQSPLELSSQQDSDEVTGATGTPPDGKKLGAQRVRKVIEMLLKKGKEIIGTEIKWLMADGTEGDIDILARGDDQLLFIEVGGAKKGDDIKHFGQQLRGLLQLAADNADQGGIAQFWYDAGNTPQAVIDYAGSILGYSNVIPFRLP